jgi:hypothetical protein
MTDTQPVVTGDDREATIKLLGYADWADATDYRLTGRQDRTVSKTVQAFAAHRTASTATLQARLDAMADALTPSGATKAAYHGDFWFPITRTDADGEEYTERAYVPWTTVKEIMAAIKARAQHEGEKP